MPKKVTIENLAQMVQRGFEETAKKVDMYRSFEQVDKHFEQADKHLAHIDLELGHLNARMSNLERDVAEIRKHFVYRDEFEDALARIALLEKKLGIKSGK